MMSAPSLPHPSPTTHTSSTKLVLQVRRGAVNGMTRRHIKPCTFTWDIWLGWPFKLSYWSHPLGEAMVPIWKVLATWSLDISYGCPTFYPPGKIRIWILYLHHHHCPSWAQSLRVIFSFTYFYFCLSLLALCQESSNFYSQMVIQRVGPTSWIFLPLSHSFTLRTTNIIEARGPSFLFKLILVRPLEVGFLSSTPSPPYSLVFSPSPPLQSG